MKAKVLMLTLLGACALSIGAQAQQEASTTQNLPGHKTIFNKDGAGSHWFIDIQGGAVMLPFGKANNKADFMDRVSLGMPVIGIGKWHSPWFGSRVELYGWRAYGFEFADNASNAKLNKYGNFFAGAQYQFLFDVVNYFAHYDPKRVFHVVPYVGVGLNYLVQITEGEKFSPAIKNPNGDKIIDNIGPSVNAGLMFKFRLGRRVDLNLEAQMIASKLNFRGTNARKKDGADIMALVTAGLGFNIGATTEWVELVPMDWGLVNDLNAQINSLRAENAELSKRPVSCPECPEPVAAEPEIVKNVYFSSVFFRLNSAKIDANQMVNLENSANYAKESGDVIYLCGYADAETGTSEYNMEISERRVKAVADILINKYDVPENQIVTEFKGSDTQPFGENKMNRVVIATGKAAK